MLNRKELVQSIKVMKGEYAEALAKGNERLANQMVDEILRLEVITKEEIENKALAELSKEIELTFDVEEEEALNQSSLIASFKKQLRECYNKKLNTTKSPISDRQLDTILAGMRDRVGLDINQEQIAFVKGFNMNQASALISVLNGISFYNQRVQLTKSLEILKNREDFAMIIEEVKRNIHKKAWFDANDDLLRMSRELQEPTDAQIRRIANVAK